MTKRKKSSIEKDLGRKKNLYKKEDEVKNRATEAKKSPNTEVNNRMDKKKKVPYRENQWLSPKNVNRRN